MSDSEIAKELGRYPSRIFAWKQSDLWKKERARLLVEVNKLEEATENADVTIAETQSESSPAKREKAVVDILEYRQKLIEQNQHLLDVSKFFLIAIKSELELLINQNLKRKKEKEPLLELSKIISDKGIPYIGQVAATMASTAIRQGNQIYGIERILKEIEKRKEV